METCYSCKRGRVESGFSIETSDGRSSGLYCFGCFLTHEASLRVSSLELYYVLNGELKGGGQNYAVASCYTHVRYTSQSIL